MEIRSGPKCRGTCEYVDPDAARADDPTEFEFGDVVESPYGPAVVVAQIRRGGLVALGVEGEMKVAHPGWLKPL